MCCGGEGGGVGVGNVGWVLVRVRENGEKETQTRNTSS